MANPKKKAKAKGPATRPAKRPAPAKVNNRWKNDASVRLILDECTVEVMRGLTDERQDPKADFLPAAVEILERGFGPKIFDRNELTKLDPKRFPDWNGLKADGKTPEKQAPLLVSYHLGRICGILAGGPHVTPAVALVAAIAVQKDENCPRGGGRGDWCV